jgi:hypothetical protein
MEKLTLVKELIRLALYLFSGHHPHGSVSFISVHSSVNANIEGNEVQQEGKS